MKKVLPILFLLGGGVCGAQTWAPTGAKWTFGWDYIQNQGTRYNEWISTGDTLVDGHICKLIKRNGSSVVGDLSDNLITYEDSNKVYLYNINQFTVLYDFNKNAGDTWTIMIDTSGLLISVDSTGVETLNGFTLKALYVSTDGGWFNGKILEHIGHVERPTPHNGSIEDLNNYTGLRCYEDSAFGFYSFGIAPSCYYTDVAEIENPFGLTLFPNPFSTQLTFSLSNNQPATIILYDIFSRQILQQTFSNTTTLNTAPWQAGIYFYELRSDWGEVRKGEVVKQ